MKKINGIDVSVHNGKIDWKKVKASGVEFAIIRIGWARSNGAIVFDAGFTDNLKGALAAGLKVGIYFYMYAKTVAATYVAAENVVAAISMAKENITLPVFIDMEEDSIAATGRKNCNDMVAAWACVMQKAGFTPGQYVNPNWLKNYVDKSGECKLWLAHYAAEPYTSPYIWQYTDKGKVDGISGNVDRNIMYLEETKVAEDNKEVSMDNVPASWAKEAVEWCQSVDILRGDENGNLRLHDAMTREEMCVLLHRLAKVLD